MNVTRKRELISKKITVFILKLKKKKDYDTYGFVTVHCFELALQQYKGKHDRYRQTNHRVTDNGFFIAIIYRCFPCTYKLNNTLVSYNLRNSRLQQWRSIP